MSSKEARRLRIRIKNNRDMWVFCVAVTVIAVIMTETILLSLYLSFGDAAFDKRYAFYIAAIVPVLVAMPTCFITARMALQLSRVHAQLRQLAETDELTGLTQPTFFLRRSHQVLSDAQEANQTISLLVIDADYFKQLNDTYGHATGDAALQFITERLTSCVRKSDLVCRLGGEEFAVLLPGMSEEHASKLADRILEKVSSQPMVCDNMIIEMSVSCGIADTGISYKMTALFKAADDALYAAKDSGRNRSVLYSRIMLSKSADQIRARH